ncbi:GNAT family N-acetyltransferase [Chloroflexota bacterium]
MTSSYIVRGFRPADTEQCLRLHAEAEREESGMLCLDFAGRLSRPGCSPGDDIFVAETAGEVIGCLEMFPETGIGRVVLSCQVQPAHRRRGVSRQFLHRAEQRANELGVRSLQACVDAGDALAKTALSRLGFRAVRRFLEMRTVLEKFRDTHTPGCQPMRPGEEAKLTRLQNRSFAGSWGYHPNTLEQITYHFSAGEASPEDVILCCLGDKPAGYCWTMVFPNGKGAGRGRVFMMGVDPEHRGEGIGRRVLTAGLAHLKRKGIAEVDITVDSENEVAISLYRATGFEAKASSLWYERLVD